MAVANTVTNFQQTIWSKSILRSLEKITSLRNHCNFQYEKESKNAKEVKILSVNRPAEDFAREKEAGKVTKESFYGHEFVVITLN